MAEAPRTVTIDDAQITRMARSKSLVKRFSFLRAVASRLDPAPKCGRCPRKVAPRAQDYRSVKEAVARLDSAARAALREALNADKVVVSVRRGPGEVERIVF